MFLDSEFETLVVKIFLNSLKTQDFGYEMEFLYVREVCLKHGLDIEMIWEILNKMLNALNSELVRKANV